MWTIRACPIKPKTDQTRSQKCAEKFIQSNQSSVGIGIGISMVCVVWRREIKVFFKKESKNGKNIWGNGNLHIFTDIIYIIYVNVNTEILMFAENKSSPSQAGHRGHSFRHAQGHLNCE